MADEARYLAGLATARRDVAAILAMPAEAIDYPDADGATPLYAAARVGDAAA